MNHASAQCSSSAQSMLQHSPAATRSAPEGTGAKPRECAVMLMMDSAHVKGDTSFPDLALPRALFALYRRVLIHSGVEVLDDHAHDLIVRLLRHWLLPREPLEELWVLL
eukprot:CAMPEP_0185163328 /NCGR_PEP_ID=MMETSP1139-20130426/7827_1 /TAXON_ID=298111 /ORGANISM="Pavlova sp., Strain CCMP459" /LENGTH=108 /DNA_ID=CAMNT_0027728679 /DNA_START=70 /DNA_END=396 /DNA_ORIENTATION=+